MLRSILAAIAALAVWVVVATLGNFALRAGLAGYTEAESTMSFTLAMQFGRLALGLVSSVAAGFAIALAAPAARRLPWIVGVLLVLMFLPVHYQLWNKFPWWYHAFFLATLAPAVVLGAGLRPGRR